MDAGGRCGLKLLTRTFGFFVSLVFLVSPAAAEAFPAAASARGDGPLWLGALLLMAAANLIAVAETSLASCSKVKMKMERERGNKRAGMVLDALERFDRTIAAILIVTNVAHLGAAALVTMAVTRRWGLSAVTVSTLLTTLALFFFAEMLPKSFAKKYADSLALRCVIPLRGISAVLSPLTAVLSWIGDLALRLSPGSGEEDVSVTEDEIHDIIDDMTEEGSLDEEQGDLISSALEFNDLTVESVLTPRVDVKAVDIDTEPQEILEEIRNQNHSRLPVYEGSIDNIIGILRIRRFLRAWIQLRDEEGEEEARAMNVRKLLDDPLYVTENTKVDTLLHTMSREKQSIAIVTDHYGGTVGIVTVEDILESLVGEIWDEEDEVEDAVIDLKNGSFLVDAEETVSDAFWEIGFEEPRSDESLMNKRVGEWVYEHFSTVPKVREHFEYEGLKVYVARMEHNRIRKVMMKLPKASPGAKKEDAPDGKGGGAE